MDDFVSFSAMDRVTPAEHPNLPLSYFEAYPFPVFVFGPPESGAVAGDPSLASSSTLRRKSLTPDAELSRAEGAAPLERRSMSPRSMSGLGEHATLASLPPPRAVAPNFAFPAKSPAARVNELPDPSAPPTSSLRPPFSYLPLPILWQNAQWFRLSDNRTLEQMLDPFQLNALKIWLMEGLGGEGEQGVRHRDFGPQTIPATDLGATGVSFQASSIGHLPTTLTLRIDFGHRLMAVDFVRSVTEANGGTLIVVQTTVKPYETRSRTHSQTSFSRLNERYAVSKISPFQRNPAIPELADSEVPPQADGSTLMVPSQQERTALTSRSLEDLNRSTRSPKPYQASHLRNSSEVDEDVRAASSVPMRSEHSSATTIHRGSGGAEEVAAHLEQPEPMDVTPTNGSPLDEDVAEPVYPSPGPRSVGRRMSLVGGASLGSQSQGTTDSTSVSWLMDNHDWASTSLGPRESWPNWVRAIISVVMTTPHEACFWHSKDYTLVYNQHYARMAPDHPHAFGKPGRLGWGPIWSSLEPLLDEVWRGNPISREDDLWLFQVPYHGPRIETYHRLTMVPVRAADGKVGGLFNLCSETTKSFLARRRAELLKNISDSTVASRTQDEFYDGVQEALSDADAARDVPFFAVYQVSVPDEIRQWETTQHQFSTAHESEFKVNLNLSHSVGIPLPSQTTPLETTLTVPRKIFRKRLFQSGPLRQLASPTMSAKSSLSGRASSLRSSVDSSPIPEEVSGPATEWPLMQAMISGQIVYVDDARELVADYELRCWDELPQSAVVIPILEKGSRVPTSVVIVGINLRRPYDTEYEDWMNVFRNQMSTTLAAVRAFEHEAEQAQRAHALSQAITNFLSNAAHELKSPLTLIAAPVKDLVDTLRDGRAKSLAILAQKSCSRLTRLVNSLMDFSRLEAGRLKGSFRPYNVGALTEEVAALFRTLPAVEKGKIQYQIHCDTRQTKPLAFIDVDLWERVVSNLVSNAFKYTRSGEIRVELSYTHATCEFAVTDTGPGIRQVDIPHLMERFYRADSESAVEGTGIGLSYSQELVRLHGGSLWIESRTADESPDGSHGSTFRVSFPLGYDHLDRAQVDFSSNGRHEHGNYGRGVLEETWQWQHSDGEANSDVAATSSNDGSSNERTLRGIDPSTLFFNKETDTLLIVDDNPDMRRYMTSLFSSFVKVEEASNGVEALEIIRARPPALILSDVTMPRMSGTELLAHVKADEELRSIPVILITAKAGEDERVDGLLLGADDYLLKPFKSRELIARVNVQMQIGKSRRELEHAFNLRNAELQLLATYAPVGIVRAVPGGALTYVNEAWYEMSQYPSRALPIADWAPHIVDAHLLQDAWEEFAVSDATTGRFEWQWKKGAYVTSVFTKLNHVNPKLNGLIGCVTDITWQKEREREQAQRLLEEQERRKEAVAAKAQQELLIDVTSHELRNPISAVLQCSLVVSQDLQQLKAQIQSGTFAPGPELDVMLNESIDALESIYQCGLSQSRIADDVLSLGRIQLDMLQIFYTDTDLRKESAKLLSTFATECRRLGIELNLELGKGVALCPFVKTDPVRLGQIITNLVSNAIRFTQTSAHRKIDFKLDVSLGPPLDESCAVPPDPMRLPESEDIPIYVFASVTDTGPGLAPDSLSKLFQRFAQASSETHTVFGGSGLGLFVCRKLCQLMGGRIEVASEFGKGSTFRFYIKAEVSKHALGLSTQQLPPALGTKTPPASSPGRRSLRVLIVEDNMINQKVLNKQLTKAGHKTAVASNGLEGLEQIRRNDYSEFDITLMDLEMPVMDGLTAICTLRAEEEQLGLKHNLVVALTGNARDQQKQNAIDCGFDSVVSSGDPSASWEPTLNCALSLDRQALQA